MAKTLKKAGHGRTIGRNKARTKSRKRFLAFFHKKKKFDPRFDGKEIDSEVAFCL